MTYDMPPELNAVNKDLHWTLANLRRQLAADPEAAGGTKSGSR